MLTRPPRDWDRRFLGHMSIKGNMHHKYDVSLKDAFHIIDLAAGIFFEIILFEAKRHILSPHFTFSSASLFLLISLTFPSHPGDGKLRLMRRKSEADEKEK